MTRTDEAGHVTVDQQFTARRIRQFGRLRFDFDRRLLEDCSRAGPPIVLNPNYWNALELLVTRSPAAVTFSELQAVLGLDQPNSVHKAISRIRTAIGDNPRRPTLIVTLPTIGYQFALACSDSVERRTARVRREHLTLSIVLFAVMTGLGYLIEIAYAWDVYWPRASICLLVASVIGFGMHLGTRPLKSAWVGSTVPARTAVFFGGAAVATFIGLGSLPPLPVTLTRATAQPAHIAYAKQVWLYYVPYAAVFWIVTSAIVNSLERLTNEASGQAALDVLNGRSQLSSVPMIQPRHLAWVMISLFPMSFWLTFTLLDSLQPGRYQQLFTALVLLRNVTYFTSGALALWWYRCALASFQDSAHLPVSTG